MPTEFQFAQSEDQKVLSGKRKVDRLRVTFSFEYTRQNHQTATTQMPHSSEKSQLFILEVFGDH